MHNDKKRRNYPAEFDIGSAVIMVILVLLVIAWVVEGLLR